jgi:outer membrane protein assembly factor BamB
VLERRRETVKSFAPGETRGSDVALRDPRLGYGAMLSRAADGRPVIASSGGVFRVDDGRLGAFVGARMPVECGKLLRPGSLALVWNDELAVLCDPAGVIQIFGRDGTFRRALETTPAIRGITRISAAPNGDLLVLSSLDGVLYRAGKDGRAAPALAWDALRGAEGVAMLGDGRAWVDQDPRSGLALIGADGKELGRLPAGDRRSWRWGRNFSATPGGDVITAGQSDGRITCYGPDLALRWEFDAEKLDEAARLRSVGATFTAADGRLYVLGGDWSGIRVFGPDRAFLAAIRPDAATGSFSGASDVAVDADGNLYVADTGNNRVVKLAPRPAGNP